MQAITLDLNNSIVGSGERPVGAEIKLSLRPFIAYVENMANTEKTAKINFYKYILEQFKQFPELQESIPRENVHRYNVLFELIYTALSPIINEEREHLWAISTPLMPCFHYGTNAFYNILMEPSTCTLKADLSLPSKLEMEKSLLSAFYNLVLRRFYNFSLTANEFTVKSIIDPETKLPKYYRLIIDTRFLDITANVEMPEYDLNIVKDYIQDETNTIDILTKLIPPEIFTIEGISIVTMVDVTGEYVLESIKNIIIEHHESKNVNHSKEIATALKTLVGTEKLEFGMLPYTKLNNKLLVNEKSGFYSTLIKLAEEDGWKYEDELDFIDEYLSNPRTMIFPEITEEDQEKYPMLRLLWAKGIKAYGLFPLYYNAKLVGCLELYTEDPTKFNGSTLTKIDLAFPLLAQLYQDIITDFNQEISEIVTDKFTALQPSVEWRFHQAAYNYLQSGGKARNLPVEPVFFKDVHPFYGAVDIRNSSVLRNMAIRKDLYVHFEILEKTLDAVKEKVCQLPDEDIPPQYQIWNKEQFEELSDREILKTEDYLQRQIPYALTHLMETYPELTETVDEYFKLTAIDGKSYEHRDRYEKSLQMINLAVTRHLDEFNREIQRIYPCYFEKFRTDGVEFDIYLGPSIAPDKEFSEDILHEFRLKQLKVLAEVAQTTFSLAPYFSLPLETTQLIFVYEKLIDISFRIDEQRFDVEGSYNIRYQMVKKRIDKAHIKDTMERITQPGKIAIVYFNSWEAHEYVGYIKTLQDIGLLNDDLEYLDIEELQGVEGLKALRIGVTLKH